jgi:hypothetical protein
LELFQITFDFSGIFFGFALNLDHQRFQFFSAQFNIVRYHHFEKRVAGFEGLGGRIVTDCAPDMVALGGQVQGHGRSCRCQLQLPVARSVGAIVQRVYQIADCEVLCPNQKLFFFSLKKTFRDVLPNLLRIMEKLSRESYLKDNGSAYRYSQNYKLQLSVLEDLWKVMTDLDMLQKDFENATETVFKYVSDKQPIPLQVKCR